ncbi:MAG: hypothetical protein C4560_02635 [Nitrospiraceae bacterium]|nr:MAG: hypothetical protein C4560_02635 [Nitrospiraceae bacterium]
MSILMINNISKLLLLLSLCFLISCSTEKPSGAGRQTTSGGNEKNISETAGTSDDHRGLTEINPSETTRDLTSTKNTPPELTRVKIMPEVFKPNDKLYVEAEGSDIDGDDITILYEWTVNGEPAGDNRETGVRIKRGDRISVRITPYDGETYGRSLTLNREIRNMPPVITEDNSFTFDGKTYTGKINAADPDGDALTYSLKTAPDGMTIDSSGLIRWDVPSDFGGKAAVTASVSDGNGGETLMPFNVTISPATK